MTVLIKNKKLNLNYEVIDKYTGGMELVGQEVKSLKKQNGKLDGAFLTIKKSPKKNGSTNTELWIKNMYIAPYQIKNSDVDPERERKILIKKSELIKIEKEMTGSRLTLAPVAVKLSGNLIKMDFALVRGKKKYDKREDLKKKAQKRDSDRELKQKMR